VVFNVIFHITGEHMEGNRGTAQARDCAECRNYMQNLPDVMTAHLTRKQLQEIYAKLCQNCTRQ